MNLERLAWITTAVIFLITAAAMFATGYTGYGTLAIGLTLAASFNIHSH